MFDWLWRLFRKDTTHRARMDYYDFKMYQERKRLERRRQEERMKRVRKDEMVV